MYSIGDFSKMTGLTVKTLRFYHEQGILPPAHIDGQSGYRYYAARQVETARVIAELRRLEFSIKQIAEILDQPLGTVLARQHRALKKLRDILEDKVREGPKSE